VRKDGLIMQPDKPATYIDAMMGQTGGRPALNNGHIWAASSSVADGSGLGESQIFFHYALSIDVQGTGKAGFKLSSADFYPLMTVNPDRGWVAHRWHAGDMPTPCIDGQAAIQGGCIEAPGKIYSDNDMPMILNDRPIMVMNDTHVYDLTMMAPIGPNGWVFLGDVSSYVSVSSKRFKTISYSPVGMVVAMAGVVGETITLTALKPNANTAQDDEWLVMTKDVTFTETTAQIVFVNTMA